jgi:hypothetical protein
MIRFRREFLKTAAATATFASLPAQAAGAAGQFGESRKDGIAPLFGDLPGDLGLKIQAPSLKGKHGFTVQVNADKMLFAASAIKTFALCEALRQADSPDIDDALETKELPLDASVWSWESIFNPPT